MGKPANRIPSDNWIQPPPARPSEALIRVAGHPLVAQILLQRGHSTPAAARAFLDPDDYTPASPTELPDVSVAAQHLRNAIERDHLVLVWGDFDVDGQTATALLISALHELGAQARAYIPHRLREGHGIRKESLRRQLLGVDLLLTCDTGVAEFEAIRYARDLGVTALISDHHDLPPNLPPADALVNPKRLPRDHPLYELPGVGVAYILAQELYRALGAAPEEVEKMLDLVALGIVADVATQTGDTRYLLQRGLQQLRQTQRIGLQALMQSARLNPAHLTTEHIGFSLGPRLNALGRLGDANLAVELLCTTDLSQARILAAQLEALNSRRQLLTDQIYAAAQEQITHSPALLDEHALVLSGPHWHPGVIGIVASRLADLYRRPAVLISEGDDGQGQGSARSVPGLDIHAAISSVGDLLTRHGGHPGAAGFGLPVERIAEFRHRLSRAVEQGWDPGAIPGLVVDAQFPWSELSLELVDTLNVLAPFGEGNPPVVLVSQGLELASGRVFGRDQAHRALAVQDTAGTTREVIWWRGAEHSLPAGQFDLAYRPGASDYRGERSLQIEYIDARAVAAPPVTLVVPTIDILDHRTAAQPTDHLRRLLADRQLIVWAEGYPAGKSPGLRRDKLEPAPALVIWTPPPGPKELRAALDRVSPQQVHLFAVPGAGIDPNRFIPRLAGMIKHAIRQKEGAANVEELAAATGQRAETVRGGIRMLDARGDVRIVEEGRVTIRVVPGDGYRKPELDVIQARLQALLQETAAYRAYYARTPAGRLI